MNRLIYTFQDTLLAAFFLVPVFLILNAKRYRDWKTTVWYLAFALYLSAVYAVAGLPAANYYRFDPNFNLIPFRYMFSALETTLLNVVLFIPLGFFLPVLWQALNSIRKVTLSGLFLSLVIEFLQIFTLRATDINDLMTNTLGAFLGCCAAQLLMKLCASPAPRRSIQELYIICGAVFIVMFFLQPFLVSLL